jgi:pyridoxal phosphate enzyme (YggS family)
MPYPGLAAALDEVRATVAQRQAAGGWSHPVTIVAVTKTHGPDAVRAAYDAGLRAMGENRVQELLPKMEAIAGLGVDWHLVGTLQRNKARQVAGRVALIHSVDRLDLAAELDRRTAEGARQAVLVQVNCSGEPQKGGAEPAELPALLDALRALPRLAVRGLMTMAALDAAEPELRRTFAELRGLRDAARRDGHDLSELSMGMSGDYALAVEEGATMIRLGTVLFGERGR